MTEKSARSKLVQKNQRYGKGSTDRKAGPEPEARLGKIKFADRSGFVGP